MSTATTSAAFDLGGGGNSFEFDTVGASVTGRITVIEELQQTDMNTGLPAEWDNGKPKMMVRVELQTDARDDDGDEGKRSIYLKGSRKPESKSSMAAVLGAVQKATGGRVIQPGSTLTLTYVGDGVASRKGYNAPKQYEAVYIPQQVDLGGGDEPAAATTPAPEADTPAAGFTAEAWAALPADTRAQIKKAQGA